MADTTLLTLVWAALLAFAVFMYVVMDGFDLGIGILFPVFGVGKERDTAMNSIAPVWDGNETWLVLGGGGLLAAFPLAYAVIMSALYAPLVAMLLALVFRGVAFEFRWRDPAHRAFWDFAFTGGSFVAAFMQGIMLGALLQGELDHAKLGFGCSHLRLGFGEGGTPPALARGQGDAHAGLPHRLEAASVHVRGLYREAGTELRLGKPVSRARRSSAGSWQGIYRRAEARSTWAVGVALRLSSLRRTDSRSSEWISPRPRSRKPDDVHPVTRPDDAFASSLEM